MIRIVITKIFMIINFIMNFIVFPTRVHFLEIQKFKYFLNITKGVHVNNILDYSWNIIFTCYWRQLKFNISRIKSNQACQTKKQPLMKISMVWMSTILRGLELHSLILVHYSSWASFTSTKPISLKRGEYILVE